MARTVTSLWQELQSLDEHSRIEAKRADSIGDSVMQTVCAFANEPGLGGGWLLLGVCEPDETHQRYWLRGIENPDRLLGELGNNCRCQFDLPLAIQSEHERIEDKLIIAVFVAELDASAKPCGFTGKFGTKNKKKTGVWRRGINSDYECTQQDLAPLLLAKAGLSFEQTLLEDAEWADLDPGAIAAYRQLRSKVRPHAEELQANDPDMLKALNLVKQQASHYLPNVAGLLLFGKPLALRRLLPAIRVDYVRIQGTQWVEDPHQRFSTTLDLREPLIRAIPKIEATILDDMPQHFRLLDGETQRTDHPLLPHKVVREAVVNALMHRDYQVHQPTLIVRYSNRLEIRNAGYSLKPADTLGEMGSRLRNPFIAAVLYDLNFAETKGSGIGTMRRLLKSSGLTAPVFTSDRTANEFTASYLLHQLMGEAQLAWLQQFTHLELSDDEAKALILARETGAIDNAALRAITGLDTLGASQVLRRLTLQHQLMDKGGNGPATYYQLNPSLQSSTLSGPAGFRQVSVPTQANAGELPPNAGELPPNAGELPPNAGELPSHLAKAIAQMSPKARQETIWPIILQLCAIHPRTADDLAKILQRQPEQLRTKHLKVMRDHGLVDYLYPEVINHPEQAYVTTDRGQTWAPD